MRHAASGISGALFPLLFAFAWSAPCRADEGIAPKILEGIKNATTFIRVTEGKDVASGSGFVFKVDGETAYVVTNHHVVSSNALVPVQPPPKIEIMVVLGSGTRTERMFPAEVLGSDPEADLAILKIVGVKEPPAPLNWDEKREVTETLPVYVCGFPFGRIMAFGKANPSISIGKASISSLRRDESGDLVALQLDGALNPGNSGGPIVDSQGRLIGIAVATIRGAGIGLAIPSEELARVLQGRVSSLRVRTVKKVDAKQSDMVVEVRIVDPFGRIKSLSLHHLTPTDGKVIAKADPQGHWAPLEGATKEELTLDKQLATVQLRLNPATMKDTLFQVTLVDTDDKVHTTAPIKLTPRQPEPPQVVVVPAPPQRPAAPTPQPRPQVRLPQPPQPPRPTVVAPPQVAQAPLPPGAIHLNTLNRAADKFTDKPVVCKARMAWGIVGRGDVYELQVFNENDARPLNVSFTTTRGIVTQWTDEVKRSDQPLNVLLTIKLDKKEGDNYRFLATKIQILDAAGKVVQTIE